MVFLVLRAKKSGEQIEEVEEKKSPMWKNILFAAIGLAAIIIGGRVVVNNASALATALGMSESLVALTIVAVGTSLPELVTSVVASYLLIRRSSYYAIGFILNDIVLIVLWGIASAKDISLLPQAICFAAFLLNDAYGFVRWKIEENKQKKKDKIGTLDLTVLK